MLLVTVVQNVMRLNIGSSYKIFQLSNVNRNIILDVFFKINIVYYVSLLGCYIYSHIVDDTYYLQMLTMMKLAYTFSLIGNIYLKYRIDAAHTNLTIIYVIIMILITVTQMEYTHDYKRYVFWGVIAPVLNLYIEKRIAKL